MPGPCRELKGRVAASDDDGSIIVVETPRCESCTGYCALRLGSGSMRVPERLPPFAPVSIIIDPAAVGRALSLIFGLPLVAMLLGAWLAASHSAGPHAPEIGMGIGFAAGVAVAILACRRIRLQRGIVNPEA